MTTRILIGLVVFCPCVLGCMSKQNPEKDKSENRSVATSPKKGNDTVNITLENNQKEFKLWLKDTLIVLNGQRASKQDYTRREVVVGADSLALSIKSFFYYEAGPKHGHSVKQGKPSALLGLLSDYGEYPTTDFQLSFNVSIDFYPSFALGVDHYAELEDIKIVQSGGERTSEYYLIRGRISSKKVLSMDEKGQQKEELYDFIWDGDSLKKVLVYTN